MKANDREQRVLIVGAGGHGQVVADVLLRSRDNGVPVMPVGYIDDDPTLHGKILLGLPVIGGLRDITRIAHDAVIVAVGNNRRRQKLFHELGDRGEQFTVARHPSAVIAPDVDLQPGTLVCAGAVVNPGTIIGPNVIVNTASSIDHHNRIGAHVHIAPGVRLGGDVVVGAGTLIGIGATVMPQNSVGSWSIVGAGALVTKSLPDNIVVVGVPARIVRQTTEDLP